MTKTYQSVEEMVKDLSEDSKVKSDILNEINSKMLSRYLFSLRCERGLTQAQLAEKIKCSQGTISKIENSDDTEITIKDLLVYGEALGLQLEVGFRMASVNTVGLIKHHFSKITGYLDKLLKLAGKDKVMIKGVRNVHIDTINNLNEVIMKNIVALDNSLATNNSIAKSKAPIHISPPVQEMSSEMKKAVKRKVATKKKIVAKRKVAV